MTHPAKRGMSLRLVLLFPFLIQILLTGLVIEWLAFRNGERAVSQVASKLRVEVSDRVIERLDRYLSTPVPILELNSIDIEDGHLDIRDFADLASHFLEEARVFDEVNQIYFGRNDGEFVGVATLEDGSYALNVTEFSGHLNSYALNEAGDRVSLLRRTPFDPRQRPWYRAAASTRKLTWSEIYAWASIDTYGITLSKPYIDATGTLQGAIAVDLSLVKINNFLRSFKVGETGKVFILEASGALVASSTPQTPFHTNADTIQRIEALDIEDPLIRATTEHIEGRFDLERIQTTQTTNFESENVTQFVQIAPWQDDYGLNWLVVVVMPTSDFMAQIERNTQRTFLLCTGALLVSSVAGVLIARRIARPILKLNDAAKKTAEEAWTKIENTTRIAEVQELTATFNHMTDRLQAAFNKLEDKVVSRTVALKSSERRYQSLFEDAPVALWEADFSLVCHYFQLLKETEQVTDYAAYFNKHPEAIAVCKDLVQVSGINQSAIILFGTESERDGRIALQKAYGEDAREVFKQELISLLSGQVRFAREVAIHTASGEQKDVILKHFLSSEREGDWSRVLIGIVDISDRRHAERALLESQRTLDAIFNNTFQFIGLMSVDGTLLETNQAALASVAARREDAIDRPFWDTPWWRDSAENQARLREMIAKAAAGKFARQELAFTDKTDREIVLDVSIKPVFDDRGQTMLLIPEGRDITDRKQAEIQLVRRSEELAAALAQLKETQAELIRSAQKAALGNLVAGVAHEINTPVGTAIMMASTLENSTDAIALQVTDGSLKRSDLQRYVETARECSHLILSNLNRAGDLVQSFKQVAVDRTHLNARTFKVKPYVADVVTSLSPQFKHTPHRISVEGDDTLAIHSYPGALSQIVTNLVVNSLTHAYPDGAAGHLTLSVRQDSDRCVLTYADDGCGVAPEHLDRIFEPFFSTASHQGGSGLGLHLVHNLVSQKLEGTIAVRSQVGGGTTFEIVLPMSVA